MKLTVFLLCSFFSLVSSVSKNGLPRTVKDMTLTLDTAFFVYDINTIDSDNMDFRFDFYVETEWRVSTNQCINYQNMVMNIFNYTKKEMDLTLKKGALLTGPKIDDFWIPDTMSPVTKSTFSPTLRGNNRVLKITGEAEGCTMKLSIWLAATVGCQMDFKEYPVDIQLCPYPMRSHAYDKRFIRYKWKQDVAQRNDIKLLQHSMDVKWDTYNNLSDHSHVTFSYLAVCFVFKRNIGYSIVQVYVPTTLLVLLSYCSFWLGFHSIPGRVSLSITTLLALITQYSYVKQRMPRFSYISTVDVYMLTCLTFVFSSMVELTLALVLDRRSKQQAAANKGRKQEVASYKKPPILAPKADPSPYYLRFANSIQRREDVKIYSDYESMTRTNYVKPAPPRNWPRFLDNVFRRIYPILFLGFNVAYWPYLVIIRKNQERKYNETCHHADVD